MMAVTDNPPIVDWGFVAKSTPAMHFTLSFDKSEQEFQNPMINQQVRLIVAEVCQVSIDRVVVEYKAISTTAVPAARRLLQTSDGTQANVWIYKDTRVAYKNTPFNDNTKSPLEMQEMFEEDGGFKEKIAQRLEAAPTLEFNSIGDVKTTEVTSPEIPKSFLKKKDTDDSLGAGWIVFIVIGAVVFVGVSIACIIKSRSKNNTFMTNTLDLESESLVHLIQRTKIRV
jgi:hypothetical protein